MYVYPSYPYYDYGYDPYYDYGYVPPPPPPRRYYRPRPRVGVYFGF